MFGPLGLSDKRKRRIENTQQIFRLKTITKERPSGQPQQQESLIRAAHIPFEHLENLPLTSPTAVKLRLPTTREPLMLLTNRHQSSLSSSKTEAQMKATSHDSFRKHRQKMWSQSQNSNLNNRLQHAKSVQMSFLRAREQLISGDFCSIEKKNAQIFKPQADKKLQPLCRSKSVRITSIQEATNEEQTKARYREIPMREFLCSKSRGDLVSSNLQRRAQELRSEREKKVGWESEEGRGSKKMSSQGVKYGFLDRASNVFYEVESKAEYEQCLEFYRQLVKEQEQKRSNQALSRLDDFSDVIGDFICEHSKHSIPQLQQYQF